MLRLMGLGTWASPLPPWRGFRAFARVAPSVTSGVGAVLLLVLLGWAFTVKRALKPNKEK